MANVTGSSTTVTSFSSGGTPNKGGSGSSSTSSKPIDSSNQPGWGAVKGEKPAETTYGGAPGSGGTYTSTIKNAQGGYDPISKQEATRQGIVQTEQQRQANFQAIGYGASQKAIEDRYAREDYIKQQVRTSGFDPSDIQGAKKLLESPTAQFAGNTEQEQTATRQALYNQVAFRAPETKPYAGVVPAYIPYEIKSDSTTIPAISSPTIIQKKGFDDNSRVFVKGIGWMRPKTAKEQYESMPIVEATSSISDKAQTQWERIIGKTKESGTGIRILSGMGKVITTLPAFGGQLILGSEAIYKEPEQVPGRIKVGLETMKSSIVEDYKKDPYELAGFIGGSVLLGKAGSGVKGVKNIATKVGEIKVGNIPTGLELLPQRSSVVSIVPKRQTQILEIKPQFKSPLTGNYESTYNRQQIISDNKIMIKQLTELGKIQTKRLSSQRSTSHTSLEKLSPEYKAKAESNLQKAKSMLETKPLTETILDTKQVQSSKGILMTGVVSTTKSNTKQVQSPIQNTESLNATALGLKQELKQEQTMKPLTSEITGYDTRQAQSQAPSLKLSTKTDVVELTKKEIKYDPTIKTPLISTTRGTTTPRTPEPKIPKKPRIKLSDSQDITTSEKSSRKKITADDIMDEPTQVSPWYPASLENVTAEEMLLGGKRARHIKEKSTSQKLFHKLRTQGVSIPTARQFKSRKLK